MTVVASNFVRKANDLYETEPWATRALLRHFPPVRGRKIWEPAAGNHKIADVLRWEGADVTTSDIAVYGREHSFLNDFLDTSIRVPLPWFDIITNPPYGLHNRDAVKFARLALQRTDGWAALLLTAKFDFGNTRYDLFADNPRFAFKIALTDRIQWFPGMHGGTEDHAWYVWGPAPQRQPPRLYYEGKYVRDAPDPTAVGSLGTREYRSRFAARSALRVFD